MMTEERAQKLAEVLSSDSDQLEKLFDMDVNETVAQINAGGYDFTADELKEFAEAMVTVSEKTKGNGNGELDAEELDNVAGGFLTVGTVSCVCSIVSLCGPYAWKAGQWIGKKIVGR